MEIAENVELWGTFCMKVAEMCCSKSSCGVNFGRCYGKQGWAEAVKKYFLLKITSIKLSESLKSVPQGVLEIFEEVYQLG